MKNPLLRMTAAVSLVALTSVAPGWRTDLVDAVMDLPEVQASHRLERAPKSFEEIKPDLDGPVSDDLLRSPNDGEPFVILWGVDFVRLPPAGTV